MELDLTLAQYEQWQAGAHIQEVAPHLSASQREFIISGYTEEDWTTLLHVISQGDADKMLNAVLGKTLGYYRRQCKVDTCRWCKAKLPQRVDMYDHEDGWPVEGIGKTQWLSVKCLGCNYEWSLWKLGVPRYQGGK